LAESKAALDAANVKAAQVEAAVEAANASKAQVEAALATAHGDLEDAKSKLSKAQDDLAKLESWRSRVEQQVEKSNAMRTERGKAAFEKVKADLAQAGTTFDGEWQGSANTDALHVRSISLSKDDFPCAGTVKLQLGEGSIINLDVTWRQMDGLVVGLFGDGIAEEIAWIHWSDGSMSGKVSSPIEIGNQPRDLSFSQFKKKQDNK
jgi:hypothetical protein